MADESFYIINVTISQFFISEMTKSKNDFVKPDSLYIIVSKLIEKNVCDVIEVYIYI